MINAADLSTKVTCDELRRLMAIHGEGDAWDFKRELDLSGAGRSKLIKHILAFMNTSSGGHIVFGVENGTWEPVGLPLSTVIDTTDIHNAVCKCTSAELRLAAACYDVESDKWHGKRRFGILYIAPSNSIAIARSVVQYNDKSGKPKVEVSQGQIMARRGAKSEPLDQAGFDRLVRERYSQGEGTEDQRAPLDGQLPAREEVALDFVGRARELGELWAWFSDPNSRRWLLAGDGGKGKTAIAYEFATQVKDLAPKGYECVLWMTAKRRRLREGLIEPIGSPDFTDLASLLDGIATRYGWAEFTRLPLSEKKQRVIELLRILPALVIADDIDSLDTQDEDAIEFLAYDIAQTSSKVLLTTRRVPFGLNSAATLVSGLEQQDGTKFIESRRHRLGLDVSVLTPRRVKEILDNTEGSPLFVEELLRLAAVLGVGEAISKWREYGGDLAREYALRREFEAVSETAKVIVFACCVSNGPISLAEIQDIANVSQQQVAAEMRSIQNLFLVNRPRLIEGVERFDVNRNTRALVLRAHENSNQLDRIKRAYRSITGRLDLGKQQEIAGYIRQANSLLRLGEQVDAEGTVRAALERYPNHPDLIAELGVVYSRWVPQRLEDARQNFHRAAQLKCDREWMYCIWTEMSSRQEEWMAAAEAAEAGIKILGGSRKLSLLAGYARSRLGQELRRGLHSERADTELRAADRLLRRALAEPEQLADYEERRLNSRTFRALVLNCCELGHIGEMHRLLDQWLREHPDDSTASSEAVRLRAKYPASAATANHFTG